MEMDIKQHQAQRESQKRKLRRLPVPDLNT